MGHNNKKKTINYWNHLCFNFLGKRMTAFTNQIILFSLHARSRIVSFDSLLGLFPRHFNLREKEVAKQNKKQL